MNTRLVGSEALVKNALSAHQVSEGIPMTTTAPGTSPRFVADCPTRPILDQVADKWTMMALTVLEEPTRFNEIRRQLEGVTQRVLTQTLRRLERNGLVVRRVLETSPVGVEYSLTPLGESFREPFTRLYEWALAHSDEIQEFQRAFDARNAQATSAN
ncbi:helix-turn-helix domain-containing protein [Micromonospora haikouensis]|uniref:winged helix-turn-helix transcriptional regulator n=1 Tax=Micromonospora TaxID=1873 RepID=UPI001E2DD664|nr:helix-turn-helix domain-containing protein [Micromonospora sp. NBRC 110038]